MNLNKLFPCNPRNDQPQSFLYNFIRKIENQHNQNNSNLYSFPFSSSSNPRKCKLHRKKETKASLSRFEMDHQKENDVPHVLIFPLPIQGPVNCMLKFAELLCLSGIRITFLNSHYVQERLGRHTDALSRFKQYPNFRFETVSDGLADDHPRNGDKFNDLANGLKEVTETLFKEMLIGGGSLSCTSECPVTVIIADGYFSFALDFAQEIGVPLIYFETISPCALWTFLRLPHLIEAGEFPFKDDDLDVAIKSVPGTKSFLRRRDLPSFCRDDASHQGLTQLYLKEGREIPRARGLILNTFDDLDALVLPHMRTLCPNIYSVGPIHAMHKSQLKVEKPQPAASNSIWAEETSCLSWLDGQSPKSVIFVSIGSMATMTFDQLIEIWHGLVNSGSPFLWVRRPGSVNGNCEESQIPVKLLEATRERGCIIGWAPQEAVLAHPSIGGFFTHSGWNSTLESVVERVPMVCWPNIHDQLVNSRFVSEVWKVGLDMKDTCDRAIVEKMVRGLMDVQRRDEFVKSADALAKLAAESVARGGSSYINLERLIEDIKLMSR